MEDVEVGKTYLTRHFWDVVFVTALVLEKDENSEQGVKIRHWDCGFEEWIRPAWIVKEVEPPFSLWRWLKGFVTKFQVGE